MRMRSLPLRIVGLTVGSVVLTAGTLLTTVLLERDQLRAHLDQTLINLLNCSSGETIKGIYRMCVAFNGRSNERLEQSLEVAKDELNKAGKITFGEPVHWTAVNQANLLAQEVALPKFVLGGQWLGQNSDPQTPSLVVDAVQKTTRDFCTIFQRMNEAGDMMRVCTNIRQTDGRRAIGTYIPARQPDGTANPVVAEVLQGETYHGRALVLDRWHATIYTPLWDSPAHERVIGMLFVGVDIEDINRELRQSIMATTVGKTGYVYVLQGKGERRGSYVVSKQGERDGENLWEVPDSDGRLFVQSMIRGALATTDGSTHVERYHWKNPDDPAPRAKVAVVTYFEPWDWVIGAGAYEDDYSDTLAAGMALIDDLVRSTSVGAAVLCVVLFLLSYGLAVAISKAFVQYATALETANVDLRTAKQAAEAASEAKSTFLANMSHELRTPLNGVIGMTELLLFTDLDEKQRRYVSMARTSGVALLGVISNILDFSKIEAGKMDLENTDYDLREIVNSVSSSLVGQAESKGLRLITAVDADVPHELRGDPGRVRQVLLNLANNAVKFTPEGEVKVHVQRESAGTAGSLIRFTVTDTGIGIAPDQAAQLFQSFRQVDASTTREYGGTGLGLAICKQLVELMGGQIGLESQPGAGSSFWFTIPLAHPQDETSASKASPDHDAASRQSEWAAMPAPASACKHHVRILLAEDDEVNREVATSILTLHGYQCASVANGKLALAAAINGRFDLVLMDCHMPEMDGFDTTRAIREHERQHGPLGLDGGPLPIVALTADAVKGDRERCLAAGMDDYLTKPLNSARLVRILNHHLHQPDEAALPDPESGPGPAPANSSGETPPIHVVAASRRTGLDPEFIVKLVAKFGQQAPADVRRIAVCFNAGDLPRAADLAHRLKGTAGYIGAEMVQQLSIHLEARLRADDHPAAEIALRDLQTEMQRCLDYARNSLGVTIPTSQPADATTETVSATL